MKNEWYELPPPTPEQVAMTEKVEHALAHEINLLAREGVPVACILTGLSLTVANLITCQGKATAIAPWFEKQAEMVRELQGSSGKPN